MIAPIFKSSLFTLLLLAAGCAHSGANPKEDRGSVAIVEDEQIDPEHTGTLILRKDSPNAPEILRESCPGGYDPVDGFSNPPSTEIGISRGISGDTKPYIRYRCRGL